VPSRGSGDARDQRAVEARDDVLIYSTPPLKDDLEVTGPIRLELYASSSAMDTDITAKFVDVWRMDSRKTSRTPSSGRGTELP
jgi:predicted acyl esterase